MEMTPGRRVLFPAYKRDSHLLGDCLFRLYPLGFNSSFVFHVPRIGGGFRLQHHDPTFHFGNRQVLYTAPVDDIIGVQQAIR